MSVYLNELDALATAVNRLLDKPQKRPRLSARPQIVRPDRGTTQGAHIHLERTSSLSIPSGAATAVSWTRSLPVIVARNFSTPAFPAPAVTIQQPGYYNVAVQLGWDTYEGGGTVTVIRVRSGVEQAVWPPSSDPGLWSDDAAQLFEGVAPAIPCKPGDQIKVYVAQSSGSAQDIASATLALYLVDRTTETSFYVDVVLADGPVGYWRMDDAGSTAADSSGNNHDGSYVGSPTQSQSGVMVDGSGSPSVQFNGSSQYVTVDGIGAGLDGATDLTVEAWVNLDTLPSVFACVFEVYDPAAVDTQLRGLFIDPVGKMSWFVDTVSSTVSVGALSTGQTYHIVVTHAADDTLKFYINGALDKSTTSTPVSTPASTWDATIGMDLDTATPGDFFDGFLDEVAVYDRVLSAEEISEHYEIGNH